MSEPTRRSNFLTDIIDADLAAKKNGGKVVTRFPPEPNGYLHVGHAKSIILNFGTALQFEGRCHLRFDDTNPATEETEYVESIKRDVRWLGFEWGERLFHASDFFEKMYQCAIRLVKDGKAFVDSQGVDAIREQRGDFGKPGRNSPFRDRTVAENLALLEKMRRGEFKDGECVLRAKIDMAHPNVLLRDPLLYRIRHAHHYRTGDQWPIYPMYDFAHPLEDAFEGVTHSFCTLEFESNREMYDWVLDNLGPWETRPRQYEFARLELGYTIVSKRKLLQLVTEKHVEGWDDPRMPTIAGLRRRGVTPEALRDFAELIGVAKNNSVVDIGKFEFAIRNDLENRAPKGLAVLNPLKVTVTNWPAEKFDEIELAWWPGEPARAGTRKVPFGRQLLIEQEDFSETPPKDWKRLAPGREVRLIGGYVIKCDEVVKGSDGQVVELRCSYDPDSRGGDPADKRKVPGSLNWVEATRSVPVTVRLYDRLFMAEQPEAGGNFLENLNPDSLTLAPGARVEPGLAQIEPETRWQFIRQGYFFSDPKLSRPGAPVFNRIIRLKDTWAAKAAPAPTPEVRRDKKPKEDKPAAAPKKGRTEHRNELRASSPELAQRYTRYQQELGLAPDDADLLTGDLSLAKYFDAAVATQASPKSVARWLTNELLGLVKDEGFADLKLDGAGFGRFVALVDSGKVSPAAAKTLLAKLVEQGGEAEALAGQLGLEKVTDSSAIVAAVEKVLTAQAAEAARYRAGEKKLFGVFVGAVMKELQGTADAALVRKVITEKLG